MKIIRLISPANPILPQDNVKAYVAILKTLPKQSSNHDDVSNVNPFPPASNG